MSAVTQMHFGSLAVVAVSRLLLQVLVIASLPKPSCCASDLSVVVGSGHFRICWEMRILPVQAMALSDNTDVCNKLNHVLAYLCVH